MFGTGRTLGVATAWQGLIPPLIACATWTVFGAAACVGGLAVATLASFVVYLPLAALALNGGHALRPDAAAPTLTPTAEAMLLALWSATVLLTASLT